MRVLFLIQGWDVAASRYRVVQYLPSLQSRGVTTTVRSYPVGIREFFHLYKTLGQYDVLFLQRKRFNPPFLQLIRRRARSMVYDFDDAVMYRNSTASSPFSRTRERRLARVLRACDEVIAGNSFLSEKAREYADHVTLIPTAIDGERYVLKDYTRTASHVTIGWIGDHGSIHYLERMRPVWEDVGKKHARVQLKIICDTFFDCQYLPVVKKMWSSEEEISDLQSLDIGVMPLIDDPWSRGKCGLKILQYYGVGVPAVCTPVGVNRDVVQDGFNGYWATDHDEWVAKLSGLIENADERRRMGLLGRESVMKSYTVQACAPIFLQVLSQAAELGNT